MEFDEATMMEQAQDRERKIRDFGELASVLGFTRDPSERPSSPDRTYRRVLSNGPGGRAWAVVGVHDIGLTRTGPKGERIELGVRRGESQASVWGETRPLLDLLTVEQKALLKLDEYGDLDKTFLKRGGYGVIFGLIKRLEAQGYFARSLVKMMAEYRFGLSLVDLVLAQMSERLPGYQLVDNCYGETKEIYLGQEQPLKDGRKKAICVKILPRSFVISVGKARFNQEIGGIEVDRESFEKSHPCLVWYAGFEEGKRFKAGDLQDATGIWERALTTLTEYLASKK